jgi:hypothetical protein
MNYSRVLVIALLAPLALLAAQGTKGRDWFAAPNGLPSNDGSRSTPLDLATALDGRKVKAGDTVWLRGGTYTGPFKSSLAGTADAPITVRQVAGERAVIVDTRARAGAGTMNIGGAWTVYRDFEVANTSEDRSPSRTFRPMGFEVQAPNTKFVNLVVHDTGMGFGFWKEAVDAELYGNVIFNGGSENVTVDFGHGHGIYTQNNGGTKSIRDNVVVNQFGFGIHAYPNPGGLVGLRFEGNVIADSGAANPPSAVSRYNNILVSGYRPYQADRIELVENYTYLSPRRGAPERFVSANVCLGCSDKYTHKSVVVRDNYFAGGAPVAIVAGWESVTMRGNTFIGNDAMAAVVSPNDAALRRWDWDQNTYIGTGPPARPDVLFALNGKPLGYREWLTATGFDRSSTNRSGMPTGTRVFVRPNLYEPGRANVIVYNWDGADEVAIELGSVLQPGVNFEVRNAMDYLGEPVITGTFDGRPIRVSLRALRVAQPTGTRATAIASSREFAVFVVRVRAPGELAAPNRPPARETTPAPPPSNRRGLDDPALLSLYTGLFVSKDPPARFRIFVDGGRLKSQLLHEPGQPIVPLVPLSPTRFQFEGAAGFFAVFDLDRGGARAMTIERPNAPSVTLLPQR